jgi:hypothetical protein
MADIHTIARVERNKRQHVLALVTRDRTYYIQAENESQVEEWFSRLLEAQKEAQILFGKPPQPLKSRQSNSTSVPPSKPINPIPIDGDVSNLEMENAGSSSSILLTVPDNTTNSMICVNTGNNPITDDAQSLVSASTEESKLTFVSTPSLNVPLIPTNIPHEPINHELNNTFSQLRSNTLLKSAITPTFTLGENNTAEISRNHTNPFTPVSLFIPLASDIVNNMDSHNNKSISPIIPNSFQPEIKSTQANEYSSSNTPLSRNPSSSSYDNTNVDDISSSSRIYDNAVPSKRDMISSSEEEEDVEEFDSDINDNRVLMEGYLQKQGNNYNKACANDVFEFFSHEC